MKFKKILLVLIGLMFSFVFSNDELRVKKPYDLLNYELYNRLELPRVDLSKNIIQNSSFEQGSHYFTSLEVGNTRIVDLEHDKNWIKFDESESFHGDHSLRLQVWDNSDYNYLIKFDEWQEDIVERLESQGKEATYFNPMITTYNMQVENGKTHTVSFYAKSDFEGLKIKVFAMESFADWGKAKVFTIGKEWKRYEYSIIPSGNLLSIAVGREWTEAAQEGVPSGTFYWIDAMQLEQGSKASDYDCKDIQVSIAKSEKVVDVSEDKTLELDVNNFGDSSRDVDLKLEIFDYFKNKLFTKNIQLADIDANDKKSTTLDLNDVFTDITYATLEFSINSGDFSDKEIFRYAVHDRKAVKNTRNQKIFGFGVSLPMFHKKQVKRYNDMGFGLLMNNSHNNMTPEMIEVYDKIDAPVLYPILAAHPLGLETREMPNPSRWEMRAMAKELVKLAESMPTIKYWKVVNEPEYGWRYSFLNDPVQCAQFIKILGPMLKKARPDTYLVSPDLANVNQSSLDWMEIIFKEGAGKAFDILSIHTYQKTPEIPSLDQSLEEFIRIADEYGFEGEIWLTEGGHYLEWHFPPMNYNANYFEGHFSSKMPAFSKDISEYRVGVALGVRTLLTVLKHSDRIQANVEWSLPLLGLHMITLVPHSHGMAYHALARETGNARFVKDYNFSETIQAYVFEKDSGEAIAYIWDYDNKLSTKQRLPFRLNLNNPDKKLKVSDFYRGSVSTIEESSFTAFDVGYFPKMIRADSIETLTSALDKSFIRFEKKDAFLVSTELKDSSQFILNIESQYHETLNGQFELKYRGQSQEKDYSLKRNQSDTYVINLNEIKRAKPQVLDLDLELSIKDEKGDLLSTWVERRIFQFVSKRSDDIEIDGEANDWQTYASFELKEQDMVTYQRDLYKGPSDLSGAYKFTWDENNLYFLFEITDEKHVQNFKLDQVWNNDGLQLFFDMDNNGTKDKPSFDDDYGWHIAKTANRDMAYRAYVPAWQTAFLKNGLSDGVELSIRRKDKKTYYEFRIPKTELMPLSLRSGSILGMGVMVNDADIDVREAALVNTQNQEGWKNPSVYPDVVLVD